MKPEDRLKFGILILGTSEAFGARLTDAAVEVYWLALRKMEYEQIEEGVARHLQDPDRGRFMPRPADIIGNVHRKKSGLMAWCEVEKAMVHPGQWESVQFEDGTINAVIADMGGWIWLCDQNPNEPWTQKEFERRYEEYAAAGVTSDKKLIGAFEAHNGPNEQKFLALGFRDFIRPMVFISDGLMPKLPGRKEQKQLKSSVGSNGGDQKE